jgi:hypothetical protein
LDVAQLTNQLVAEGGLERPAEHHSWTHTTLPSEFSVRVGEALKLVFATDEQANGAGGLQQFMAQQIHQVQGDLRCDGRQRTVSA